MVSATEEKREVHVAPRQCGESSSGSMHASWVKLVFGIPCRMMDLDISLLSCHLEIEVLLVFPFKLLAHRFPRHINV